MKTLVAALFALVIICTPAAVDAKSVAKEGFAFPRNGTVSVVVLRPDVQVGTMSTGGIDEPNAEWTAQARELMAEALGKSGEGRSVEFKFLAEPEGEDGSYVAEYRSLFRAVSNAAMTHKIFPGNRLPTKKQKFDWTLGPGTARLREIGGADYALFFHTHDSYGSTGRKVAQVLAAGLFGVWVPAGIHAGYAGLVDLSTGDLVWLNADIAMGGDVRTPEGAAKRVEQLLAGFPAEVPQAGTAKRAR